MRCALPGPAANRFELGRAAYVAKGAADKPIECLVKQHVVQRQTGSGGVPSKCAGLEKTGCPVAICDQKNIFGDQIIGRGGQFGD